MIVFSVYEGYERLCDEKKECENEEKWNHFRKMSRDRFMFPAFENEQEIEKGVSYHIAYTRYPCKNRSSLNMIRRPISQGR